MSEVYDAGVLADVQQAQRIIAAFLTAESFKGLMVNVSTAHFVTSAECRLYTCIRTTLFGHGQAVTTCAIWVQDFLVCSVQQ